MWAAARCSSCRTAGRSNPLNTVTINHITGFPDPNSHVITMGNSTANPQMYGFVFTNNLVTTGRYPVWNTGGGGSQLRLSRARRQQKFANCFTTYTFAITL